MSKTLPMANAFGGNYPVCTEDQAARMEEAFKSALTYSEEHGDNVHKCSCELIIELLGPNPSRSAVIEAAATIAREVYTKKAMAVSLMSSLEDEMFRRMPVSGKEN